MRLNALFLLLTFSIVSLSAQQFKLSPSAEVSVLTVGSGESLNDAFGHNAFRIKDRTLGVDIVYGYGEYDFGAPNFYLKFARGKLNYLISRDSFRDFYNHYLYYNRTIEEQVLNLSPEQKQRLFDYLENNYKPENRRYLYDFFYDNCATRIRDVSEIATNSSIQFDTPKNFESKTFRELIHEHVKLNSWGSFGIDIALGSVVDKEATPREFMFLPKYIHEFFENAKINNSDDLVKYSSVVLQKKPSNSSSNFLLSPLMIVGIISIVILYITYKDFKTEKRSRWLDIILFSITGIIGIILLLLWFATDHTATAQNYNLLWAFPLNLFVIGAIVKNKQKNWVKSYIKFLIIMLCLMTLHWIIGIQAFTIGLIPLIIALLVRYVYLLKCLNS
ncbi:DUF4105 domain-containing protein [Winogradskyella sp. SYSU M77433]|uniref:Lnb N-terminal periplasmic domain-containing protein n=1 Tax=Winogradskyella sp. SYSU M77433 TaxID=3042722 RepID=UPI00248109A1|nr:DUF4105 domain-containing protein [Winogradskyella sp. SYSU M77433]MDH7912981.1 DUF4105 domain-containing protein [Winogradskyella sp. SYSU M77433]